MSLKTLSKAIQQRDAGNSNGTKAGNGKGRQAGAPLEVMIGRQAGRGCSKTPKNPLKAGEPTLPPPKKKSFSVTGSLT